MHNYMYSSMPNLVLGFHGCSIDVFEKVVIRGEKLKQSTNAYDWLGHGIYFWENDLQRAESWAVSRYGVDGRVIGAVLDLGYCFDLLNYASKYVLQMGYERLKIKYEELGKDLPKNRKMAGREDVLLRNLDCAVIQEIHQYNAAQTDLRPYDSVRGPFIEGSPAYPGSELKNLTHIQICVVNPNCIKGYFRPIRPYDEFAVP